MALAAGFDEGMARRLQAERGFTDPAALIDALLSQL
jgi:hypothetical protein